MTSRILQAGDEYLHPPGPESNWNESRYVDFTDADQGIAGWLRLGMRPNEGHAEMSVCLYLPDGRIAFYYERSPIDGNGFTAGGQSWHVDDPYKKSQVKYTGPVALFEDPWELQDPKAAFAGSPRVAAGIDLTIHTRGLEAVMGSDQEHIDRIFLPGQADWHYQHLAWVEGTVTIGDRSFTVTGRGGKDHSWGPRNWLAKTYLRWYTAISEDDSFGFMLVRAVGPTKQTRSGHVWIDGAFHLVDDFEVTNNYSPEKPHQLLSTSLVIHANGRTWSAMGTVGGWIPLRHRSKDEHGKDCMLRIVKSPTTWTFEDGTGSGSCEVHDRLDENGVPVGLHD